MTVHKPSGGEHASTRLKVEARGRKRAGYELAEDVRYNERTAAERVNARLKDEFGGRGAYLATPRGSTI